MTPLTLQHIAIDLIEPDPDQPRRELEAPDTLTEARTLAGLSESIKQYGILQPLRVYALDSHRFRIISGERRYRAALMAKLTEVPVVIVEPSQVLLEQLTENVQRKAMTTLELANAIQLLMQSGLSGLTIAEQLGINPMQVSMLGKLPSVSTPIREALQTGVIVSPRAAYDLNKLPLEQQLQLLDQARRHQQVLGQGDVNKARSAFAKAQLTMTSYSPPVMAKTEVAALMAILEQPLEHESYDPAQDRATILCTGHINANPDSDANHHGLGEASLPVDTSTIDRPAQDEITTRSDQASLETNPSHQPTWAPFPATSLIRVPAFTLNVDELKNLAQQWGESVPDALADPGSWLVDLLKQKASGH